MIRKLYLPFLVLTACLTQPARAQQDPQFSLYMFNPVYYNPAAAGSEGAPRFQLMHRTQWAGYQGIGNSDPGGAPSTQLFTFHTPLAKLRSGVGLVALNDRIGPQINQSVQVSYALRLPVQKGTLSLGVQGGLFNRAIDFSQLRPGEPDPLIPSGRAGQARPDLGVGLHYSTPAYYVGASVQHLTEPSFSLGGGDVAPLSRVAYFTAGYRYEWNYALDLMPSVLYKYVISPEPSFVASSLEVSLLAMYDKRYWAGLSYRQRDALSATIGLSLLRNNALRFGYAFDFVVGSQQAKSPTSHEILLSYTLPEPTTGRKPIIRTPRFRF